MKLALTLLIIVVALVGVSLFPVGQTETPPFASSAFQRAWNTETVSATKPVDIWGSEPLLWRVESYYGAPNNRRTVQYFDRGRMELQSGSSEVTIGLLARELTTGLVDLGEGVEVERQPPEIPIDSGELSDRVPTYLTMNRLVEESAVDRSDDRQPVLDWVDRSGVYQRDSTPERILIGEYVEETGHNLPDVTVELFERSEFNDGKWLEKFGYPISEPYWTHYRRTENVVPSLVQVFERRILVYSPTLDPEKRFTVANSGRHYYMWRYGSFPQEKPDEQIAEELVPADLTLVDEVESYVYARDFGTPLDLALSSTGHLLILTEEGQILRSDARDPDGLPEGLSVWAENIEEPLGMVTRGDSVLVSTATGARWYREADGRGLLDDSHVLEDAELVAPESSGRPVLDSGSRLYQVLDEEPTGEVLREFGSDEPLVNLDQMISDPGPLRFSGSNLFVAGRDEDQRASVLMLPASGESMSDESPTALATFPQGSVAHALAVADEAIWPLSRLGSLFVAVQDPEGSHIFALSMDQPAETRDLLEVASGFSRPSAMIFGLDGSLYVADADAQTITRIMLRD